jgi:hypothetical protein
MLGNTQLFYWPVSQKRLRTIGTQQLHLNSYRIKSDCHHKKHRESIIGFTQAKRLILGPSARRTKDLLKLNRDQLRWVVGLLTGHCHLKGHLFKLGLTDDPICESA